MSSSFSAELHSPLGRVGANRAPFGNSPLWGPSHFALAREYSGWLHHLARGQRAANFLPLRFHFTFIGHDFFTQRPRFQVSIREEGAYANARLEQNASGWLGLYGGTLPGRVAESLNPFSAGANNIWALEVVEPSSKAFGRFYLSDTEGQRVGNSTYPHPVLPFPFGECLRAGHYNGEPLKFYFLNMRVG
ncbi:MULTISPECIES: hypothetical protein [unclassified Pseudomonas]|uniref:hypothetical protein n=1 Tax=unclassified Pseudomonas TaxID=196821 RepID=UPI000BD1B4E0|nr:MULTISPECIES: hypothetical protein [unclassified Pseudomonas]PVZ15981.1 hypothetical protein F474_01483 [Pseudomonas sp. URIL14HWK12:I12]PVZ26163.1 hypothetical protein F470_01627 [Pseudomonas sp. URIL14HWK12:I10]PVZ36313.1 hypothetical protein F472_01483 [Pseudomonas sp. URIL14HWK12:I11]SNZ18375.1 hypothetical protein SAMN05660463_03947 [Pseudomonas sp. URIL14HWK12:I9]